MFSLWMSITSNVIKRATHIIPDCPLTRPTSKTIDKTRSCSPRLDHRNQEGLHQKGKRSSCILTASPLTQAGMVSDQCFSFSSGGKRLLEKSAKLDYWGSSPNRNPKYINIIQFNSQKEIIHLNNGPKTWRAIFFKEFIEVANRFMKRYSTSLIIRETHTTMRSPLTYVKMAIIKKKRRDNKCW